MKFLSKILLTIGVVLLFFVLQTKNNKHYFANGTAQKETSFEQIGKNNLQCMLPKTLSYTVATYHFYPPIQATFASFAHVALLINYSNKVASKAFLYKSINAIPAVSCLLFPKHYFW